jgi:hypothetical protein
MGFDLFWNEYSFSHIQFLIGVFWKFIKTILTIQSLCIDSHTYKEQNFVMQYW